MYTTKQSPSLPIVQNGFSQSAIEPVPNAQISSSHEVEEVAADIAETVLARAPGGGADPAQLWKTLPREEQGILSHLAKSAEAFCTPEHLAKLGKSAKAIGSLLGKGLIASTPLGALQIIDPLLKEFAGEASMHMEASASVAEGGPKTFQFNFGMNANVRKLQPGH